MTNCTLCEKPIRWYQRKLYIHDGQWYTVKTNIDTGMSHEKCVTLWNNQKEAY